MKAMNKMQLWLLSLMVGMVMTACGSAPTAPVAAVPAPTVASVATAFGAVTGLAGGKASTTITVTAYDINGNPMANQPVTVDVVGTNIAVGLVTQTATGVTITGITNAQGVFTAILTYVAANGVTVTATAGGIAAPVVPAPNPTVTNILLNAVGVVGGVLADGTATQTVTIKAIDAGLNPIANQLLTATATSAQNGTTMLSAPNVTTAANGQTTITVSDLSAVNDQVTLSITGGAVNRVIVLSFTGTGTGSNTVVNGNRLTPSIAPISVPADGVTAVTLTVNAFDTYTNTNAVAVRISLSQGVNDHAVFTASAITDAAGNATFVITDVYAETVQINASDAAGSIAPQTITFTPYASKLTVKTANNTPTFLADGTSTVAVTFLATGPHGKVAGEPIALSSSSLTAIFPALVVTDAYGQVTATVKDTIAEKLTLTAKTRNGGQVAGLVVTQSIDLYAVVATPQIIFPTPPAGPFLADGYTNGHPVSLIIKDQNGTLQANQTITFSTNKQTAKVAAIASNQTGNTTQTLWSDANGAITVFVSDSYAEAVLITATATDGTTATSTVQFIATQSDRVSLSASALAVVPNSTVTFSASILDQNSVAVANAWVQFDFYSGAIHFSKVSSITNASGVAIAIANLSRLGIVDVYATLLYNVQATIQKAFVQVQVVQPTPQIIIDQAGPFLADRVTTGHAVRLHMNDVLGAPSPNQPLSLSITGGAGLLISGQPQLGVSSLLVSTNGNGVVDVYVSNSITEFVTLTATATDGTSKTSTIQFVAANADTVSLTASTTVAAPNTTITFSATVQSAIPNLVANAWVQFDAYAGGVRVGQSTAMTSATGIATANFSFAAVGLADVYATLVLNPQATKAQAVQQVQTVYATPQVIIDPAGPYLADGVSATHAVRIRVNDNLGTPIANQPITLTATGAAGFSSTNGQVVGVSPFIINSSANGVIDVYVSDALAELVTITATPTVGAAKQSTIQFVAASAQQMVLTASPSNANPDGVSPITVTATVKNGTGVPVPNAWVQFSSSNPANITLSATSALTAALGKASVTLTSLASISTADVYATLNFNGNQQAKVAVSFVDVVTSVLLTSNLSQALADGTSTATVTARVVNASGQPLAGRTVLFSHQSSATLSTPLPTDIYGQTTVTVTDQVTEVVAVSALSEGVSSTPASINVTFSPVVASMSLTVIPLSGAVAADNASVATIVVNLKDLAGAPINGQTVQFIDDGYSRYSAGYVSSAQLQAATAQTDPSGTATITVSDPYAESVTIRAIAGGQSKTGTINFIPTTVQTTVSLNQPFLANGVQDNYVSILVKDTNGNPVTGQVFTINKGANKTIKISSAQIITAVNGQATVLLSDTIAETATLTFTDAGGASFAVPVTFVAANPKSIKIIITPNTVVTPDGKTPATITLQVKDQFGAAVSNAWIQLDAYSGGVPDTFAQLANARLLTGANGIATTTITRIAAGTTTITARMPYNTGVVNAFANAVFDAPVTAVLLIPNVNQVRADGAASITLKARVLDGAGQRLAGRTVVFNHQSSATVTTPSVTDAYGETTVTINDATPETVSITATSDNIVSTATSLTFTTVINNMTLNVLPSTGAVPADGTSQGNIIVNLKDAAGAPIANTAVQFFDDGYSSAAQLSAATAVTDATGTAFITVTDVYAEAVIIRAVADNQSKTGTINFTLTQLQFIVGGNMPFLADGIQDHYVTVQANDNQGNPAAAQVFQIATASQTMIPSQTQIITDINGFAQVSVANHVAETANITFTDGGALSFAVPVSFVAADPYSLTIQASPANGVNPDGLTPATITVFVKDQYGAAVSNAWVALSTSGNAATLAGGNVLSDVNGIARTTVTSTTAGTTSIIASAPRNPLVASVPTSVVFETPVASVQLVADQTTVDAYATAQLTATLLDANANVITGRAPTFAITSGVATVNAAGQLSSKTAGLVQVTATAGGVTSTPLTVTFVPPVNTMTMTITPSSKSVAADGTSTVSAIINLKDASGIPIAGQTVRLFDDTFSSAQFNAPMGVTSISGTFTFTIRDPVAERVNIRAVAGYNTLKTVTNTISFANTTLQVIVTGAQPFLANSINHALNLLVKDQYGNTLTTPQAFTLSSSTATMIPASLQVSTDNYGKATLNVQNSIAETATLTMTHASGLVFSVPVQFVSADPYAMQVSVTPTTGVLPDGVSVATATVIVTDVYGAVVPNAWVKFEALTATGAVDIYATLSTSSLFTDATGRAVVTMSRTQTGSTVLKVSLPRNTSIATQSRTVSFAGKIAQTPAAIALTASAYTLKSDGSDRITLNAVVKDTTNVGVAGATVTFTPSSTGDAGILSSNTAITDAYGQASVIFGAGTFDRSNRTINITASAPPAKPDPTPPLPIVVSGSTVSAQVTNSSSLVADGVGSSNIVLTVKDSAGNPVPFVPISGLVTVTGNNNLLVDVYAGSHLMLQTGGGSWLGDTYTTTNTSGTITLDVYAHSTIAGGQIDIAPSALGARTLVTLSPSLSGDIFGIISPYQTATGIPTISLGGRQTIVVASSGQVRQTAVDLYTQGLKADPYAYVKLSSSSGSWAATGGVVTLDPYIIVPFSLISPYAASADFYGSIPGLANIQADEYAGATVSSINYTAPITGILINRPLQTANILIQVNATTPAVVSVTSLSSTVNPSTATQDNSTTITATVRDINNKAVSNIPVTFSIKAGPSGGERMSPVTVFTDTSGNAVSNFIAGGLPSAANGIDVYAQVFSNGKTITGNTLLTIGGSAVSVSLGTSSKLGSSIDGTSYILPMSALVTDINGSGVAGAIITLRVRPKYFAFGHRSSGRTLNFFEGEPTYWPGYFFENSTFSTVTTVNPNASVVRSAIGFAAEDRNNNQILDFVTTGVPEDGYTKLFDFNSPLSAEITDNYTSYNYTNYLNTGVFINSYSQVLTAYPLMNQLKDSLGNLIGNPSYMSTNANGTPSCQLLSLAQMNAIVGVPPRWYCRPMQDGALTPTHASAGSVPQIAITGVDGLASFVFTYQKRYAQWLVVELTATIQNTAGTESVSKISLKLPEPNGNTVLKQLLAAYPTSPFGDKP